MRHRFFLLLFIFPIVFSYVYTNIPRNVSKPKKTPVTGILYKSAWNKDSEYLLISDDVRILVRGSVYDKKLASGCTVILKSKLMIPDKPTNPGEFDYRKYLKGKGVDFYTYAGPSDIEIIDTDPNDPRAWGAKVRNAISETLDRYLTKDRRALVMAIMTGDAGGLNKEYKSNIQLAGLSHLMAVSGSHVAVFLMPFRKAFRNKYMNIWVRNVLLIIPLLCFLYISDATPSVSRAVFSSLLNIIALLFRRKSDSLNSLGLIGSLQLMVNPYVIYDTGFLLSYGSVFSMILIQPVITAYLKSKGIYRTDYTGGGSGHGTGAYEKSKVISFNPDSLLAGISVNIGILPFMSTMFNRINLAGIVLTCVASPIASCILISGYLLFIVSRLGSVCISRLLSYFILTVLYLLEKIVRFASVLPEFLTVIVIPAYGTVFYICYYFLLTLILFKVSINKAYKSRIALLIISLSFILYKPCSEVIFYDVGQGNCIYVESKYGTKGLIDAGEGYTKVSELLLKNGVSCLDFVILSHGHSDHIGGMYDIADTFKIKYLFVPDNVYDTEASGFAEYAKEKGVNVIRVSKHVYYEPDEALSADLLFYFDKDSLNNSSLMVKLKLEQIKVLIASDIEHGAESYFVRSGAVSDCDILQVAHHGSETSSTEPFLNEAKPEVAVICVGRNNKFGHPNKVVLDRLNMCDVYRTDNDGAIIIEVEGSNFILKR